MVIDSLQSGKVYSAVLKFNGPVYLTDLSISTSYAVGCVSVEVWGGEGGEGGAVRLAQSAEIQERNLMLGNLSPPPLCQFVRVSPSLVQFSFIQQQNFSHDVAKIVENSTFVFAR